MNYYSERINVDPSFSFKWVLAVLVNHIFEKDIRNYLFNSMNKFSEAQATTYIH